MAVPVGHREEQHLTGRQAGPADVQLGAPVARHQVDLHLSRAGLPWRERRRGGDQATGGRGVQPVGERADGRADGARDEHEHGRDRREPPAPAAPLGSDLVEKRDRRQGLRRPEAVRVGDRCVDRAGLRAQLDEVEERGQAGQLSGFALAYLAGTQVARERLVLDGVESTEHEGAEEQLQLLVLGFGGGSGGHWVTPISSRTVRSERTA